MSSSNTLAKRYARALWGSVENGGADKLLAEFKAVAEIFDSNAELKSLALSPAFTLDEKNKLLAELLEKAGASVRLKDFMTILVQRERFELLSKIYEEFRLEYLQANKVKEAVVESAYELSENEREQISKLLEAALDSRVQLVVKVEPSLIAGLRVDVDGRTIDATIRANVDLLKKELLSLEAN